MCVRQNASLRDQVLRAGPRHGTQPARELPRVHCACLARDLLPASKYDQRRNAADIEACCRRRLILGIQFGESKIRLEFARSGFEKWRHGDARTAPRCPEIDDQRQVAAPDVLIEVARGQSQGFAFEECEVALWTARRLVHAIARQTHHRIAMSADDVYCFRHTAPISQRLVSESTASSSRKN